MRPKKSSRAAHVEEWGKLSVAERAAWINLLRVHRSVTDRLNSVLARNHGLTLAEWDALVHLAGAKEGIRMGDLAERILLSPSGMTRMIDRLEAKGLVERRTGKTDAREALVGVTGGGLNLLAEAAPTHNRALETHFLRVLTPAEVRRLAALLTKVADSIESAGGKEPR
ncbi:MAG TPA: MarR family winged helix-turn-helix transcriptional regulator [Thermoplasmata archaeon]